MTDFLPSVLALSPGGVVAGTGYSVTIASFSRAGSTLL